MDDTECKGNSGKQFVKQTLDVKRQRSSLLSFKIN